MYFVNSTNESNHPDYPHIYNCYTEANGTWNEDELWKAGIDIMVGRNVKTDEINNIVENGYRESAPIYLLHNR